MSRAAGAEPLRVLVVDDSRVMRHLITKALVHPDIQVVGAAADGVEALQLVHQLDPDVVTLDIEMPGMGGLETLAALRQERPRTPVIMCSTLTERGGGITLDALTLGASDYVTKPSVTGGAAEGLQRMREELLPKVLLWRRTRAGSRPVPASGEVSDTARARASAPGVPATASRLSTEQVDAVVVGISTGGPVALEHVLDGLPGDLPVPVLVVQHMPPLFTQILAERLDSRLALKVSESAGEEIPGLGEVWIAPGGHHLEVHVRDGVPRLLTTTAPPENSCRPAVDVLFRTAAQTWGRGVLAVVLTGMGKDGLAGAEAVRAHGGKVLVQDRETSLVWGMPGAVATAGLADAVLPLDDIAAEITRLVRMGRG